MSKRIESPSLQVNPPTLFDYTEFLPQKRNKAYLRNVKCQRFIDAVSHFKQKLSFQDIRVALLGPGNSFGEDDVIRDRPYTTSVKCVS